MGQLLREDNSVTGKTYVYTYDDAGNILSKKVYALTAAGVTPTSASLQSTNTYGYTDADWGDKLTAYNGVAFTYDAIGNPLTYNNGSGYTFSWTDGRRLARSVKNGNSTVTYTYNADGIRTGKVVNGTTHAYALNGSQIVSEGWGNHLLLFLYDAEGSPIGMLYRTTQYSPGSFESYWFEKNLQGDVIGVYNSSGSKLVSYTYDAWGERYERRLRRMKRV